MHDIERPGQRRALDRSDRSSAPYSPRSGLSEIKRHQNEWEAYLHLTRHQLLEELALADQYFLMDLEGEVLAIDSQISIAMLVLSANEAQ